MKQDKIVVVMGGTSTEAEVSRRTGKAILDALKEKGYNAEGMELNPKTFAMDIQKAGAKMVFTLVGESEANLAQGKLASSTPIGKALLGRRKGEIVDVNAPAGVIKFEILDISL